jgi:flagellar basal body rod protein FlgB
VGVDNELKKLMENKLVYQTAVEAMKRKITIIKETIRDGGR